MEKTEICVTNATFIFLVDEFLFEKVKNYSSGRVPGRKLLRDLCCCCCCLIFKKMQKSNEKQMYPSGVPS